MHPHSISRRSFIAAPLLALPFTARPKIKGYIPDQSDIQAAIDALPLTGGAVNLDGQYDIYKPIESRKNVTLRGSGMGSTILRKQANGLIMRINGNSGDTLRAKVEGMQLLGNGYGGGGILVESSPGGFLYDLVLNDVEVAGMVGEGIELNGLSRCLFTHLFLQGSTRQLYAHGSAGSADLRFLDCTFTGGEDDCVRLGMDNENCDAVLMYGCNFGGSMGGASPTMLNLASCDASFFQCLRLEPTGNVANLVRLAGRTNNLSGLLAGGLGRTENGINIVYGSENRIQDARIANPNITHKVVIAGGVKNTIIDGGRGPHGALTSSDISDSGTGTMQRLAV